MVEALLSLLALLEIPQSDITAIYEGYKHININLSRQTETKHIITDYHLPYSVLTQM